MIIKNWLILLKNWRQLVESIENGQMTKDLALCIHGKNLKREHYIETVEYMDVLGKNFAKKLGAQ